MDMIFGSYPSWSLLIVRVVLGIIFFAHGAQKVFGWFGGPGLRGTIGYFKQSLGIPAGATVLAAFTECFGGLAVLVGGHGFEFNLALIGMALAVLVGGAGRVSVDRLINPW